VRLLLARGARHELQNKDGDSALHLAASNGHVGVVTLLCAAPGAAAALALRDEDGDTALDRAVVWSRAACAAVLRAHGAKERVFVLRAEARLLVTAAVPALAGRSLGR
jgi:ankyrin repeat protein